ncbi:SDR family NAD(P)-dependent oxidoreductase [Euzebya tangerina]|uniref:SDR family NAD(P)-dependent oxidoreductase n=1 Tax=Euzebya tangerina TaxID=591198 RepID=UPI0013C354A1|nr:SDR family NAD(P)-dependent oxidoreductase [Euzebya tangerina]
MSRTARTAAVIAVTALANGALFSAGHVAGAFDGVVASQNGEPLTWALIIAVSSAAAIAAVLGRLLLAQLLGPRRGRRWFIGLAAAVTVVSLPSPFLGLEGAGIAAPLVLDLIHLLTFVGGVIAADAASRPTWRWGQEDYPPREVHGPVVVTGATGGIGRAVTMALARRGIDVIGVGRSGEKASAVQREAHPLPGEVRMTTTDLSLMSDATAFGRTVAAQHPEGIGGVVHAVGTLKPSASVTAEGIDANIASSWLARVAITRALPPLTEGGRLVNIAASESGAPPPRRATVPNHPADITGGMSAHGQAQLANDIWIAGLAASGTRAIGYGPGSVDTDIRRELPRVVRAVMAPFFHWSTRPPEEAAADIVRLLLDAELPFTGFASRDGLFDPNPLVTDADNQRAVNQLADTLLGRTSKVG